jgi:hypothetical protein
VHKGLAICPRDHGTFRRFFGDTIHDGLEEVYIDIADRKLPGIFNRGAVPAL